MDFFTCTKHISTELHTGGSTFDPVAVETLQEYGGNLHVHFTGQLE